MQIVSGLSVRASWYRGLNLQPFDRLGSLVYMERRVDIDVCTHKNNPRHTQPAPRSKVSGLIGGVSFPLVSPPFESFCRSGFSSLVKHL